MGTKLLSFQWWHFADYFNRQSWAIIMQKTTHWVPYLRAWIKWSMSLGWGSVGSWNGLRKAIWKLSLTTPGFSFGQIEIETEISQGDDTITIESTSHVDLLGLKLGSMMNVSKHIKTTIPKASLTLNTLSHISKWLELEIRLEHCRTFCSPQVLILPYEVFCIEKVKNVCYKCNMSHHKTNYLRKVI